MRFQVSIVTRRLLLRPFRIRDASHLHELLAGYLDRPGTVTGGDKSLAEQWIATHQTLFFEGRGAVFAVCLRLEPILIGAVSLTLKPNGQSFELGFWIGSRFWNRGFCTEAAEAVVQYAFRELDCKRVDSYCFESNGPSIRVLEKLGMRRAALDNPPSLGLAKPGKLVSYYLEKSTAYPLDSATAFYDRIREPQ
jgi:RimJ/RimL family protein N-acetyltransferase